MKIVKSQQNFFTIAVVFLVVIVIIFIGGSRAIETPIQQQKTVINMDVFDRQILRLVELREDNHYILSQLIYQRNHLREEYNYFREMIINEYPNLDITLFDNLINHIETIFNRWIEENERVINLLRENPIRPHWNNNDMVVPYEEIDYFFYMEANTYYDLINIQYNLIKEMYNTIASLFNNNTEIFFDSGQFNMDFELMLNVVDLTWPEIPFRYYTEQDSPLLVSDRRELFNPTYREIYRQLTYIEDDPDRRWRMLFDILMSANIAFTKDFYRNYLPVHRGQANLILKNYADIGRVVTLQDLLQVSSSRSGQIPSTRLINSENATDFLTEAELMEIFRGAMNPGRIEDVFDRMMIGDQCLFLAE